MIFLTTRPGTPKTKELSGISFVTTLPAPITQLFPIVTPGQTVTLLANQQLSPIVIGAPYSISATLPSACKRAFLCSGNKGCSGVTHEVLGPHITLSPIVTGQVSRIVKLKLA